MQRVRPNEHFLQGTLRSVKFGEQSLHECNCRPWIQSPFRALLTNSVSCLQQTGEQRRSRCGLTERGYSNRGRQLLCAPQERMIGTTRATGLALT